MEANYEGGALSSDGGLMLLRQVDQRIGLAKAVAEALPDPRDLVAQRLFYSLGVAASAPTRGW